MPSTAHCRQPKIPASQDQSPLFRLPTELRLHIFRFVLTSYPILLTTTGSDRDSRLGLRTPAIEEEDIEAWRASRPLGLLLSCSQAYNEGLPFLYANEFHVCEPEAIIHLASEPRVELVQYIDLYWWITCAPLKPRRYFGTVVIDKIDLWIEVWRQMKNFKRLKQLIVEFDVQSGWTTGWAEDEAEIFLSLQGVLPEGAMGALFLSWPRPPGLKCAEEVLEEWIIVREGRLNLV